MKCPKCGYLGFEHVERCRNCGYDFSLTSKAPTPDLPIRGDALTPNPIDDLSLVDRASAGQTATKSELDLDLDRIFGGQFERLDAPTVSPQPPPVRLAPVGRAASRQELPLFGPPIPDDEPLITKASPPRSPLAVRRATQDAPRLRVEHAPTPPLDLGLDLSLPAAAPPARTKANPWRDRSAHLGDASPETADDESASDAGVGARLLAVIIDLLILAVVDAAVVYFTMQICGIPVEDLDLLPKGPLLTFLLVQNGGYLVAFTAGGQTLGKMAVGIRVVPADDEPSIDLGRAFLRTFVWVLLAVPAGLGFLTALFSPNHRGLHDRFAGTRVVRASA
jgi:uncharacterized RDD family membrane protein YckC